MGPKVPVGQMGPMKFKSLVIRARRPQSRAQHFRLEGESLSRHHLVAQFESCRDSDRTVCLAAGDDPAQFEEILFQTHEDERLAIHALQGIGWNRQGTGIDFPGKTDFAKQTTLEQAITIVDFGQRLEHPGFLIKGRRHPENLAGEGSARQPGEGDRHRLTGTHIQQGILRGGNVHPKRRQVGYGEQGSARRNRLTGYGRTLDDDTGKGCANRQGRAAAAEPHIPALLADANDVTFRLPQFGFRLLVFLTRRDPFFEQILLPSVYRFSQNAATFGSRHFTSQPGSLGCGNFGKHGALLDPLSQTGFDLHYSARGKSGKPGYPVAVKDHLSRPGSLRLLCRQRQGRCNPDPPGHLWRGQTHLHAFSGAQHGYAFGIAEGILNLRDIVVGAYFAVRVPVIMASVVMTGMAALLSGITGPRLGMGIMIVVGMRPCCGCTLFIRKQPFQIFILIMTPMAVMIVVVTVFFGSGCLFRIGVTMGIFFPRRFAMVMACMIGSRFGGYKRTVQGICSPADTGKRDQGKK